MTDSRSFARRLFQTPFRDLFRGRITGRVDLAAVFEETALPDDLADIVRRVSRRTRLDRVERVEVARDLAEHFRDGLAAGSETDALRRDFGDERESARLIRRSMLRKRSLLRRVNRRFLQATLITIGSVTAIYLLAAARYWSQRPIVATDYVALLNEPIVALPESDRAWPRIRSAMRELRTLVEPVEDRSTDRPEVLRRDEAIGRIADTARSISIMPWSGPESPVLGESDPDLDPDLQGADSAADQQARLAAFLDQADAALAELRAAAGLPGLGRPVRSGPPVDPEDRAFFGMESRPDEDRGDDVLAGSVITIELTHFPTLRRAAQVLAADARRAVAAGDGARAVDDIRAILGLGRQVREPSFLIGQLVGTAIEQLACEVVLDAIAARPEAFDADDLATLADTFAALDDDRLAMDLAGERLFFEDLVQRFYTDDGSGNGVLTIRGAQGMGDLGVGDGLSGAQIGPSVLGFLVTPALANLTLDRRGALRIWNDYFDACQLALQADPWTLDRAGLEVVDGRPMSETMDGWRNRLRYFPLNLLIPAIDKAILAGLAVRTACDLAETVVALERTRRLAGAWPSSLAEIPSDILAEPVRDPFDGKPLRYTVNDGAPTFWTIGPDRDDDDGVPVDDRRPPSRAARRIVSPSSLGSTSGHWGADQPAITDVDGDIVVWRGAGR